MDYDNVLTADENSVDGENNAPITVLPDELLLHILHYLKFRDVLNLTSCLNKKFYELSKDPKLIPRSLTINLFRSSDIERNARYREWLRGDRWARAVVVRVREGLGGRAEGGGAKGEPRCQ